MYSVRQWFATATLAVFVCGASQLLAQSNDDRKWVDDHFPQVLQTLFPLESPPAYIAYRSHRDLYTDTLEYSFVVSREVSAQDSGQSVRLVAYVRHADAVSVYDQMMALHRESPKRSAESIRKGLRVKVSSLTESNCPAVRTQFLKFQQLQLVPPQFNVIVLHPLIHEFRVRAAMGDMDVVLYAEDSSLVQWALETRHELELCSKDH